jgi:hypothetical protein
MIKIKKNDAPNLEVCVMNCDNGLNEKLNKYELTKFMNHHSTNLLIGETEKWKNVVTPFFLQVK